jgi:two-component system, LuxR family, sensor kinase FixL
MPEQGEKGVNATASDDRLGALLDAAVDAIILINTQGHITGFNAAAQRLFDYELADVLGQNVHILMPNPYHDEHDQYLARYMQTGIPRIIGIGREVTARRRDGSTFPIELSVGEFKSAGEHGFVGIIRDISERRQREEALREYSEEFRLIFDGTPTAILISDIRGRVIRANPAFCTLFGYSTDALARLSQRQLAIEMLGEEEAELMLAEISALAGSGQNLRRELSLRAKDGRQIHGTLSIGVVRDVENRPRFTLGQFIDRSALYQAEHEAEELRTRLAHVGRLGTLGEMVSGIAHEVNQPLTAIANYANAVKRLIRRGDVAPDEITQTLEKISAQAERAGKVIHGLRQLARRHEMSRATLDCNALIREVSSLLEFELRFSDHALILELDPTAPRFTGDAVQFQQVIMNLIRNALDAMRNAASSAAVTIATTGRDEHVEIVVADDGPGLSVEAEKHLFEPFFTTKSHGMGLGLSISKSIIDGIGGDLTYERGSNGGAKFIIRLPLANE